MHPFEMTRELVDLESITENEKQVGEYLLHYLSGLAAGSDGRAEAMPVSPDRFNVYAEWGNPVVVLSTHMDTVPPFFGSSEDEEHIYGRGSCDAKGIIAAMIAAAEKLIDGGARNFGLLFVVGEELGESAIEKLLDALEAIRRIPLPEDPELGKTTLNIGTISGGRAPNIVPDAAKAELAVRLVGDAHFVDDALRAAVGDRAEVKEILTLPAMQFASLDGFRTSVVAFTTDIPVLSPAWGEPLLFGPGSIHVAHTLEEKISKRELLAAVDTYTQMTRMLLGKAEAHYA